MRNVLTAVFVFLRIIIITIHAHEIPAVHTDGWNGNEELQDSEKENEGETEGKEGQHRPKTQPQPQPQRIMDANLRGDIFYKTATPKSKPDIDKPSRLYRHRSDPDPDPGPINIHLAPNHHKVKKKYDAESRAKVTPTRKESPFIPPTSQTRENTTGEDVRGSEDDYTNIFDPDAENVKISSLNGSLKNGNDNDNDNEGRFIVKFVDDQSLNHARRLQENGNHVGTVISTIEKDHIQVMKLTSEEVEDWNQKDIVQYVEAGECSLRNFVGVNNKIYHNYIMHGQCTPSIVSEVAHKRTCPFSSNQSSLSLSL